MKSVAIAGLALVGGVAARSTIHYDRHPSDPRTTFAHPQPAQTILTAHDDEFGIVDVKTDIQTVVMPGNRGRVTIGRDDADNELDMHFNVPNNRGNFQVNDYTKTHDDFDNEFGIVDVKTDIQTVVMPGNRGRVTIGRDDADDEFYDFFKSKYQPMGVSEEVERRRDMMTKPVFRRDDADNELDMHFNVPNNRGNFQVNDYTKTHDDFDDEFGIVNVKTDLQTVVMPGNSGPVTIRRDDADNELDMHFNVPNNRGNFEVNDHTVRKDAEDDEFGIVDVKTDIQTVVMPGNRGRVTIGRDDADNELGFRSQDFIMGMSEDFARHRRDYLTMTHDDEFGIVNVKTDLQTVVMPGNSGPVTIRRDDADNELDMHFNVPNNRGNFQVNDYTKTHDDEELFLHLDVKSDIQTVVMPSNKGPVTIRRDDADNELDMHFNVPNNRGNFVVNDYTVKKDAEDDEFGMVDYDDEFAVNSKHLNKDEIDLLASILKRATQDKEGNVIIDGVKIAKIPQKVEVPKPKKFLAL